jgi:UDP-3-O-[3-hydroxymyristoyl] glucosamine N-acyltransferase
MLPTIQILLNEFNLRITGDENRLLDNVGSLKKSNKNSLLWSKSSHLLESITQGVVICRKSDLDVINVNSDVVYLITEESPRLIFAKILSKYVSSDIDDDFVNYADVHRQNTKIRIGENVFIGRNVTIGNGTLIHHNVVIHANTHIGENCLLKAGASIGTEGLGLEMDPATGLYFKFPQIGGVIIHDNVEVGPGSTVRRSALDDTIIGRGTKIGALCNIGHNCIIGENCILTCNVITSGSSKIGDNVFMGVSSIVKQGSQCGE